MSGNTISVVICAYADERWDDLLAAITSVSQQRIPAREIIVVIDHNERLLARARVELTDAGVIVLPNTGSPGLSGARNCGVAAATGDIIAFLDDDAVAEVEWLRHLLPRYDDPRVLGVGGAILPWWSDERPHWFPEEFDWVVGCTYRGLPLEAAPIRNLIGASMSFRRAAIAAAGGFRTGFGQVGGSMLRCDDTEFCLRLRRRCPGTTLLYEPRSLVRHRVPTTRARWSYFRLRCFTEGRAKALLARLAGQRDGLSAERAYTTRVLPVGVVRGLADVARRRDPTGLARSAVIVAGLLITASGYITETSAAYLASVPGRRSATRTE